MERSEPAIAMPETVVVTYEPVWSEMLLLYDGSVKVSNANDIFAVYDVDDALMNGISLKFLDFSPIINALEMRILTRF